MAWPDHRPGTYALLLVSASSQQVQIGRRGRMDVVPGYYVYVGSAFGSGGLQARVGHHYQVSTRPHWHIDYIRVLTQLREIWYTYDPGHREHQWAHISSALPGATVPLAGFGASDCTCLSHLYYFAALPLWEIFCCDLLQALPGHAQLCRAQLALLSRSTGSDKG